MAFTPKTQAGHMRAARDRSSRAAHARLVRAAAEEAGAREDRRRVAAWRDRWRDPTEEECAEMAARLDSLLPLDTDPPLVIFSEEEEPAMPAAADTTSPVAPKVPKGHKPDCPCPACIYRRREAPQPRMLVIVPQEMFDDLGALSRASGLSRNQLVRDAIEDLLATPGAQAAIEEGRRRCRE